MVGVITAVAVTITDGAEGAVTIMVGDITAAGDVSQPM